MCFLNPHSLLKKYIFVQFFKKCMNVYFTGLGMDFMILLILHFVNHCY